MFKTLGLHPMTLTALHVSGFRPMGASSSLVKAQAACLHNLTTLQCLKLYGSLLLGVYWNKISKFRKERELAWITLLQLKPLLVCSTLR